MIKANDLKREKLILLAILLFSSIFMLGCSIKGEEPKQEIVRHEFAVGRYVIDSSNSRNMFYAAVNQEKGEGRIKDTNGNIINGSAFSKPANKVLTDSGNPMWVADGFYDMKDNNEYTAGSYTLILDCLDTPIVKYLQWNDIPNWKKIPTITVRKDKIVEADVYGITETARSKNLSVRYRLKIYYNSTTTSRLYYQSKSAYPVNDYCYVSCELPRSFSKTSLVPVLVAELYNSNGAIEMVLYYPGKAFTY